jgi:hypothetical protein
VHLHSSLPTQSKEQQNVSMYIYIYIYIYVSARSHFGSSLQGITKTHQHACTKDDEEGAWQVLPAAYASAAWYDLHGILARDELERHCLRCSQE